MSRTSSNVEKIFQNIMSHFGYRRNYEVAKYFNVTPQTLSGWIKNGEIPPKHLIKYNQEVLNYQNEKNTIATDKSKVNNINVDTTIKYNPQKFSWHNTKNILQKNLKILLGIPLITLQLMAIYLFFIADPVYTSVSKVLPISKDGSSSNGFSGVAAQLGINIPLNIGGTVPWDEVYPEVLKSSDLLSTILADTFITKKYGNKSLLYILDNEFNLSSHPEDEINNRAISEFRKMINISKDRISPVVTIEVESFEPIFASELSKKLIKKSGKIQRQLKTNRVKQKRIFIQERLVTIFEDLKKMEKELREFREYNRNISSSPSLEMRVQEMGREIDLQNSLYVTLKTEYEKAKIDEVEREDMVQQIDRPSIPSKLTRPRRALSLILSLFFATFLSIFIIYFRENYIHNNSI
jgi:uncharacterized protein involved in exopolysaccharide biosynthesis